jgi:tetratricopeptide (TPR) repeat protein
MKNFYLYKTMFFFFAVVFLFISCNKSPDVDTIRIFVQASDAYSQGRFIDVMEILHGQNNFPPALILRLKAEYFSGDLEKAEKSCRRVLKLRPSSLEAGLYLARILREKGDLAGAEIVTHNLLTDNPQDIRTLRLAAELACDAGRFDDAAILLDRASEFSAESAMVLLDRARLRWVAGRAEEALDDLSRAKAMLPWDTPLLRSISNLENTIREVM